MAESNINLMYETIVADLAERAKMNMDEDGGTDDESEAILQAIDEGFFRTSDEAYVIAHAYTNGNFSWNEQICWECLMEDLMADITQELKSLRGQD